MEPGLPGSNPWGHADKDTMQNDELYIARRGNSSKKNRRLHTDPECGMLHKSPNVDTATEWERENCEQCGYCIGDGFEPGTQDWSHYDLARKADGLEDL